MPRFIKKASLRFPDEIVERHATWLEIFFDLVFAVIVIKISERILHHFSFLEVLYSAALFIPLLWTWASYTVFSARFDNNDALHWLMTFVIMFAGIIMATQTPSALESGAQGFSIGFIIGQISILILYTRTSHQELQHSHRRIKFFYLLGFGLGCFLWIISLFFEPPLKFTFWILGMSIYLFTPWLGKKTVLSKAPLDAVYIPERFGAFTIIILGQIIASVTFGLEKTIWDFQTILNGILAFILAIIIWSQYYRFNVVAEYKCTLGSGQPYIYAHIPLIISLILIGVSVESYLKSPDNFSNNINIIFCLSLILYIVSFYLLQFVAIHIFRKRALPYFSAIVALILLFFGYPINKFLLLLGVTLIFFILFLYQYQSGKSLNHDHY